MNDTKDLNGFRIKPGHEGSTGLPMGEYVWLLRRHDDKLFGVWKSRHDAIGARATKLTAGKEEWYEPVRVRVGTIRMEDVVFIHD